MHLGGRMSGLVQKRCLCFKDLLRQKTKRCRVIFRTKVVFLEQAFLSSGKALSSHHCRAFFYEMKQIHKILFLYYNKNSYLKQVVKKILMPKNHQHWKLFFLKKIQNFKDTQCNANKIFFCVFFNILKVYTICFC